MLLTSKVTSEVVTKSTFCANGKPYPSIVTQDQAIQCSRKVQYTLVRSRLVMYPHKLPYSCLWLWVYNIIDYTSSLHIIIWKPDTYNILQPATSLWATTTGRIYHFQAGMTLHPYELMVHTKEIASPEVLAMLAKTIANNKVSTGGASPNILSSAKPVPLVLLVSLVESLRFPKQSEHQIREKLGIKPPTASSKLLSQEKPIRMPKDWIRARLNSVRSSIAVFWICECHLLTSISELKLRHHWIETLNWLLNCCRVQNREVSTSSSVKSMSASLSRTFQLFEVPR